jgi:putative peptide zinc metalloprotease protein
MSTSAAHSAAPLPVARPELRAAPLEFHGRQYWTVKDPVSLRYYQLREEEYFILRLLDGAHSLDEIVAKFEQRFAPRRLRRSELSGFLLMLHREGLLVVQAMGQGETLLSRRSRRRRDLWFARLTNPLAIRLPGIDPDPWLTGIIPHLRWLFSRWCFGFFLLLVAIAAALVAVRFDTVVERLPGFRDFFGPANILWLMAALAVVKTLHELGHAVACKYYGGECHRLGVMLLIFTPTLYCDVSDAWMFSDWRRRVAVSAAGVIVELFLAAAATLLWWSTQPGWLNALALDVMFVCSVGTLLINGNPLLRYDGYYVLADWIGAPNLRQQSSSAVNRLLARWLTGVEIHQPQLLAEPGKGLLLAYGLASTIYRWLVILGILWLIHAALAPRGLAILAQLLTAIVLLSLVLGPIGTVLRFLHDPAKRAQVKIRRLIVATLAIATLAAIVLGVPLPMRVTAPLVVRPEGARRVYVATGGVLQQSIAAGTPVTKEQQLARLHNHSLEMEIAVLTDRRDRQRLHLRLLKLRQHEDPQLAEQSPAAEEVLADLEEQLAGKQREQQRLTLTAPLAGTVLSPRRRPPAGSETELPTYSGTPLDEQNLGCNLESGELFCLVGDPQRVEAVALVDQADVPLVRPGQNVRLQLAESPGQILTGRVVRVARINLDDPPQELLDAGLLPVERRGGERPRLLGNSYEVVVALDREHAPLLIGATGWVSVHTDPQPLGIRLYRALRSTFRWPW